MPWNDIKDVVLEYNDMCTYQESATHDESTLPETNIVESGEFERVLGEGMERLPAPNSIMMQSDVGIGQDEPWPFLNLPGYLGYNLHEYQGGKFDAIKHLTVAEYARLEILNCLFTETVGCIESLAF